MAYPSDALTWSFERKKECLYRVFQKTCSFSQCTASPSWALWLTARDVYSRIQLALAAFWRPITIHGRPGGEALCWKIFRKKRPQFFRNILFIWSEFAFYHSKVLNNLIKSCSLSYNEQNTQKTLHIPIEGINLAFALNSSLSSVTKV